MQKYLKFWHKRLCVATKKIFSLVVSDFKTVNININQCLLGGKVTDQFFSREISYQMI